MNPIEQFLWRFRDNKDTFKIYKSHLKTFFKVIDANPDTYFKENRDYDADVLKLFDYRKEKNQSPKTLKLASSVLRKFMDRNGVKLDPNTIDDLIYASKGGVQSFDNIPTREQLKDILSNGLIKEKALFSLMLTSGLRKGEAMNLRLNDIKIPDNPTEPTTIYLRGKDTKSKTSRITFCTPEATHFLKQWINKHRNEYLIEKKEKWMKTLTDKDIKEEDRLFPFYESVTSRLWNRLLERSGFNEKDSSTTKQIYIFHLHTTRKWWESNILKSDMPKAMIDLMMGHQDELSRAYHRFTEQELKKHYTNAMSYLSIFSKYNEDKIDRLESLINDLTSAREIDRGRLKKLERKSEILERLRIIADSHGKPESFNIEDELKEEEKKLKKELENL